MAKFPIKGTNTLEFMSMFALAIEGKVDLLSPTCFPHISLVDISLNVQSKLQSIKQKKTLVSCIKNCYYI